MINLDKLTIFETRDDERHLTKFEAVVKVSAFVNVSDDALQRDEVKAAAWGSVRRKIWDMIYGGELRDQANSIHRALMLVQPAIRYENRNDANELRTQINKLIGLINYK